MPVIGVFEPRRVSLQHRGALADLTLERPVGERDRQAAARLDPLKDRPTLVVERPCQRLEPAGPRGRIGDEAEIGFAQQNELAVAGQTPRETVRKAGGERVRQDGDAVGAPEAGRKSRKRPAHDVHVRVPRGHHPPSALRLDMRLPLLEAAGLLDPSPCDAKGAELRQGDELVRVGRKAEGDHAARFVERRACGFERPQEADAGAEREGELLARRRARRMNATRVRHEERTGVAPGAKGKRRIDIRPRLRRRIGWKRPPRRGGEGIEPERHRAVDGLRAGSLHQGGEAEGLAGPVRPEVEFETLAGVEADALEGRVQGRGIGFLQSEAVGPDCAGENDREAVGAPREIVERLGIGLARVGMIEPGHHPPRSRRARRLRPVRSRIQRLDANSVRRPRREAVEALALQRRLGGPAPIGFAPGRKDARVRAQGHTPR